MGNKLLLTCCLILLFSFSLISAELIVGDTNEDNKIVELVTDIPLNVTTGSQIFNMSNVWVTDEGLMDNVADISHADLNNLEWSVAGHIIDTDVDFDGYNITNVRSIYGLPFSFMIGTSERFYIGAGGDVRMAGHFDNDGTGIFDDLIIRTSRLIPDLRVTLNDRGIGVYDGSPGASSVVINLTMQGDGIFKRNVNATKFYGSYNWTSGDTWNIFDGSTLTFNESKLSTQFFNTTTIQVITGTPQGTISGLLTYNNSAYNISEDASDLELRVNFTGITEFNQLIVRYKSTEEDEPHILKVQIYKPSDTTWEDYGVIHAIGSYHIVSFPVFDASEHIGTGDSEGVVQIRFYQDEGVPARTHKHEFDWITLAKGFGVPSGEEVDPDFNSWLLNPVFEYNVNGSNVNSSWDWVTSNTVNFTEILVYQPVDNKAITIYGFDDRIGETLDLEIGSTGRSRIIASDRLQMLGTQIDYFASSGKTTWSGAVTVDGVQLILSDPNEETKITLHDDLGNQLILTNYANRDSNHDHVPQTNPTLFIHSDTDPDSDPNQWLSLSHTTTTAEILSGKGMINISGNLTTKNLTADNYFTTTGQFWDKNNGSLTDLTYRVGEIGDCGFYSKPDTIGRTTYACDGEDIWTIRPGNKETRYIANVSFEGFVDQIDQRGYIVFGASKNFLGQIDQTYIISNIQGVSSNKFGESEINLVRKGWDYDFANGMVCNGNNATTDTGNECCAHNGLTCQLTQGFAWGSSSTCSKDWGGSADYVAMCSI